MEEAEIKEMNTRKEQKDSLTDGNKEQQTTINSNTNRTSKCVQTHLAQKKNLYVPPLGIAFH